MFGDLKSIVDLIRSGVESHKTFNTAKERENTVLDMLRAYFLLLDCAEEGEQIVTEAGDDPVATIRSMEPWKAKAVLENWDHKLRRQGMRLRALQGFIFGQHQLAVTNPDLKSRIEEVIGSKFERANSLHAIGAALFFRCVFPVEKDEEGPAAYVALMAGSDDDKLDLSHVRSELAALKSALEEYRLVVQRLVSDAEVTQYSRQARLDTLIK